MIARPFPFLLVVSLLAACGGGGDPVYVDAPPPPEGGVQLLSPTFTIPPHSERLVCMKIPFDSEQDLYVQKSDAYQAEGGHHMLGFYLESNEEGASIAGEPHECDESDMGNGGLRMLGVGTASGSGIELPEGVAFRIPAGVTIVSQSHYVNPTDEELTAQDALNLEVVPKSEVEDLAGAFTELDLSFELPPRETVSRTVDCTMPVDGVRVPWMLPHMHEFGTHYKIELVRGSGERSVLWEGDWQASFRDDFPIITFDDLVLNSDDRVVTHCTWENTTDEPMIFPTEMCATFMVFHPSDNGAMHVCDENGEHFEL